MIRTVRIPRLAGTVVASPGCMTVQDPSTGLWMAMPAVDAAGNTIPSSCTPGDGSAADSPLSDDAGLQSALDEFAAATRSASNRAALTSAAQAPSFVLANSLMSGNVPSPLPGLGITMSDSTRNWLTIAGIALLALFLFQTPEARRR